jgi:hypothetical protein
MIWSILLFDDIVVCPLSHQTRLDSMDHDDVRDVFSLCMTETSVLMWLEVIAKSDKMSGFM